MIEVNNRTHAASVDTLVEVAENTFELTVRIQDPFPFEAGQYVWLILPQSESQIDRRAMSIINPPDGTNVISMLFRGSETSFKRAAMMLVAGDEVEVAGPFGSSFRLPSDPTIPLIFLAGGVGVAPFLGLMRHIDLHKMPTSVRLACYNDTRIRTPYCSELSEICERNKTIQGSFFEKRPEWPDLGEFSQSNKALFYISGTQGFVDASYALLREHSIPFDRMRFENFYPSFPSDAKLKEMFLDKERVAYVDVEVDSERLRYKILLSAIESSSSHIIVTDKNGGIVFANDAAQKITGYTFAEMVGQTPRLWGGLMDAEFYEKLWNSKLTGHTVNNELTNRRKNGTLYIAAAHIAPIKDARDEIIGFIGTEEDVTHIRASEREAVEASNKLQKILIDLQKQQEELRKEAARSQAIILGIGDGFAAIDVDGYVILVNEEFERMLGWTAEEIKGKRFIDFVPMFDKNKVIIPPNQRLIRRAAVEKMPITTTEQEVYYYKKKNGDLFPVITTVSPIMVNGNAIGSVSVFRDITHDLDILQAKNEFVSLAAHQLKTPVGAVSWDTEMLLAGDYGMLTPEQTTVVQEVYDLNRRMAELVNSFLNISRIELGVLTVDPVPTDITKLCNEVLGELQSQIIRKQHVLQTDFEPNFPVISADQKLLRIVFQNILSNAIKYTKERGKIVVRIGTLGANMFISVANNGEPIPDIDRPKIFTKLFRGSNAQIQDTDGNGLGLYLVKRIVEAAGGSIDFTSSAGSDTVFTVLFPKAGMMKRSGKKQLS